MPEKKRETAANGYKGKALKTPYHARVKGKNRFTDWWIMFYMNNAGMGMKRMRFDEAMQNFGAGMRRPFAGKTK